MVIENNSNGKSVIYVLRINDYLPKLCNYTIPTIEQYAKKINAEVQIITKGKFLGWPVSYEKMQIYDLGKDNEWNVLIDADILIHPDFPNIITRSKKDMITSWMQYNSSELYHKADKCFMRQKLKYGSNKSIVTQFVCTNNLIHDVWKPLEKPFSSYNGWLERDYNIDEYCITYNTNKYGIDSVGFLLPGEDQYIYHLQGTFDTFKNVKYTEDELVNMAKEKMKEWDL